MKKLALCALVSTLSFSALAVDLKTDDQKISYILGAQMAESLTFGGVVEAIELDQDAFFEGARDNLAKNPKLKLNEDEMTAALSVFSSKMQAVAEAIAKEEAEKMAKEKQANQEEADKLLAKNKEKDGVKVTKSGLQYRVIEEGKGKKPTANDIVRVHYKGQLATGDVFDSSYEREAPADFPLAGVIDGWAEGLLLMSEGAKFEFVIPPELAYGDSAPADIGPSRALIFEVELIAVNPDEEISEDEGGNEAEEEELKKVAEAAAKEKAEAEENQEDKKEEAKDDKKAS